MANFDRIQTDVRNIIARETGQVNQDIVPLKPKSDPTTVDPFAD